MEIPKRYWAAIDVTIITANYDSEEQLEKAIKDKNLEHHYIHDIGKVRMYTT